MCTATMFPVSHISIEHCCKQQQLRPIRSTKFFEFDIIMWPYRPWLLRVQNNPQGQINYTGEDINQPPAINLPPTQSPAPSQATSLTPSQAQSRTTSQSRARRIQPQPTPRDWTRRYQPSINSRVYGYPSSGGVLILPGYDIDLPFLGLTRFINTQRTVDQIEEDAFCRRLRYLGAIWWPYPDADLDALKGLGTTQDMQKALTHVCVGWLNNGGGVWVLKYSENDPNDNDLSLRAQRVGSLNMHDRCRAIEELGGRYYRHPEECEDLRWGNWPGLR